MLTIEIRFLTARYAAAAYNDPTKTEWPPHPARVFSALTAALYGDPDPAERERTALIWLAGAGPPEILAPFAEERRIREVYVPTNDPRALGDIDTHILARMDAEVAAAGAEEGPPALRALERQDARLRERSLATARVDGQGTPRNAAELLDRRPRHARSFPVAIPAGDVAHLRWPTSPPTDLADALDSLCSRVARLGHSSSLVAMRVVDKDVALGSADCQQMRWVPHPSGDVFLRVPLEDQLRLLDDAHQRFQQVEARVLPIDDQGSWYRLVTGEGDADLPVPSAFSGDETEWIVYEVVAPVAGGRRLLLDSTLTQQVARATRGTVLLSLGREASARLSGHDPDGRPTQLPHLAFVPLADVGHPHATGSILGVALVPPRDLPVGDRDALLESLFRAEQSASDGADARRIRVTLGRRGVADLRRLREPSHLRALLPSRWTRPARRWVSATAVALGRNPGNLRSRDTSVINRATEAAERSVAEACENIGLPAPSAVWTHRRSLLEGAPAAHRFMPFPDQGSGPRRVCVHAEVVFDRPVQGPVILGAGRFFGLGLCVPQGDNR